MKNPSKLLTASPLASAIALALSSTSYAATITVTTANSEGEGSLVAAVADANSTEAADTIVFDSSLSGSEINLNSQLNLDYDTVIDGSSLAEPITINFSYLYDSAIESSEAEGTAITLSSLNIGLGRSIDYGIYVSGDTLTLTNVNISSKNEEYYAYASGIGAEYSDVTLTSSSITKMGGVAAVSFKYGAGKTLSITDTTISNNRTNAATIQTTNPAGPPAGTMYLDISGSTFSENYSGTGAIPEATLGGVIAAGAKYGNSLVVDITTSTFSDNARYSSCCGPSEGEGGAINIVSKYGANASADLNVSSSTFSGNNADRGGAIFLYSEGGPGNNTYLTANIQSSTFSENSAEGEGGAISAKVFQPHAFADYNSVLDLSIINSTFNMNEAGYAGSAIDVYSRAYGTIDFTSVNNTIAGNEGEGGGIKPKSAKPFPFKPIAALEIASQEGGAYLSSITIQNTVIAQNRTKYTGPIKCKPFCKGSAEPEGPYIYTDLFIDSNLTMSAISSPEGEGATLNMSNNLINAYYTGFYPEKALKGSEEGNGLLSGDYVFAEGEGLNLTISSNIIGEDPLLGELADNGGPTQTMAPLAFSPLFNSGDSALAVDSTGESPVALAGDQRGEARIEGTSVDIGAFESDDYDGDGVTNDLDALPMNANEQVDSDGDGVGDNQDAFPADPTEVVDTDGDGIGNNADNCAVVANADQADTDVDGTGDACDPDFLTPEEIAEIAAAEAELAAIEAAVEEGNLAAAAELAQDAGFISEEEEDDIVGSVGFGGLGLMLANLGLWLRFRRK